MKVSADVDPFYHVFNIETGEDLTLTYNIFQADDGEGTLLIYREDEESRWSHTDLYMKIYRQIRIERMVGYEV